MGGFLSCGHAFGLLQHDFVREYLLELYSLSAHQYTRGTWTAPETRRINPAKSSAAYCVPSQLSVPLLVRWMLAFEDPSSDVLWLCKAIPRDWLKDGSTVAANNIPTRSGPLDFRIYSQINNRRVEVVIDLDRQFSARPMKVRLRTPDQKRIDSILLNGMNWSQFDRITETIALPATPPKRIVMTVQY